MELIPTKRNFIWNKEFILSVQIDCVFLTEKYKQNANLFHGLYPDWKWFCVYHNTTNVLNL